MADEKPGRKRSMKPKPGIIELEATEVAAVTEQTSGGQAPEDQAAGAETPPEAVAEAPAETVPPEPEAPASEEPPAKEPPRSAPASEPVPPPARIPVGSLVAAAFGGAALALAAGVVAVSSGLVPLAPAPTPSNDSALAARIAGLETDIRRALDAPAPVAPDDGALRAEIEGLKTEIAALRATPPAPVADPEIETRLAEIGGRLDQLAKSAEDNSTVSAVERLSSRVEEIAAQASAPREPGPEVQQAVAGAKSAAALAAVATLESAVARGVPYAGALASVRQHLPEAPLGGLEADAERGLPAPGVLGERLLAKLDRASAPPSTATNLVDRLKEGAFGLVRVRPVEGAVPEISEGDPWSARKAVAVRLGQGDFAGALADWEKLDSVAQQATKPEADALKGRLGAEAALDGLRAAALSQTGTLN